MKFIKVIITTLLLTSFSQAALSKTIRITELNSSKIAELMINHDKNLVVEFKNGDQIPLEFETKGDLLESSGMSTFINIKKDFFIKLAKQGLQLSLDGINYSPTKELLKGRFSIDAIVDQDQLPTVFKVLLEAYLR